jgi:hypothetical protein
MGFLSGEKTRLGTSWKAVRRHEGRPGKTQRLFNEIRVSSRDQEADTTGAKPALY